MTQRLIALLILIVMLGAPLGLALMLTSAFLLHFVFFYPLLMSGIWMAGGLLFWLRWERRWHWRPAPAPIPPGAPLVSILVPCHNEAQHIEETITAALAQAYPKLEVIAIDDGSSDGTLAGLRAIARRQPALRILRLAQNQGKAMALRMGAMAANSDVLVCIDGDARLEPDAVAYLCMPLFRHPRVGAVTGNPRIRTRSTLIGRIQVGEFSSIIGLIKRSQRIYGQVFTVSGVCAAFRRQALDEVGYWSLDMITEDIDISWLLQRAGWSIFYEPRALCWILMPETLKGLWKQRLRWAQGGAEVLLKNLDVLRQPSQWRLWVLMLEFCLSSGWAFALALSLGLWLLTPWAGLPPAMAVEAFLPPSAAGLVLAWACLLQFLVSILIERRYEPGLARSLFWIVWYPFVFWMINCLTTLCSFPAVMLRIRRTRARWTSPDRGIRETPP